MGGGDCMCDDVTHLKRAVSKRFIKGSYMYQQQVSEPGRTGNLYCWLPVTLEELAFLPLCVRISHEKPQLNMGGWHHYRLK